MSVNDFFKLETTAFLFFYNLNKKSNDHFLIHSFYDNNILKYFLHLRHKVQMSNYFLDSN